MMRRQSVIEEGKSGSLKQKFRNIRRRSMAEDNQSPGLLLRSQSVCNVDAVGKDDAENHAATEPRRTRRSRMHTQASVDVTASMTSLNDIVNDTPAPADTPVRMRERSTLMRSRSTVGVQREEGAETMRERMRRNRLSADVQHSPRHTPEPSPDTPIRTPDARSVRMRLARMASDSAASPGGGESIKERMDRRRRERQGTASDSNAVSPGGPSSSISGRLPSTRPSIDLASLKQKFSGDTAKSDASTASPVAQRAQVSRRASSSSLDVRNRLNSTSEKDIDSAKSANGRLARSKLLSGSQDSLAMKSTKDHTPSSSDLSRRQRREAWRGSHSSLAGDTNTTSKPTKEREPISWRSPKPSSGSESETSTRTAPPSRQKSSSSSRPAAHREPMSWRGSHSDLSGSGSLRSSRDNWRGSHQNLSTTHDADDNSLRARRREAWRGSHSNLSTTSNTNSDGSSARLRRKEAWRGSHSNLADTTDTSSPRLRRASSRTSVNDPSTDSNRLHRAGSRTTLNDTSTDSPRVRRSSRASISDHSTDSNRLHRAGSKTALNDTSTDSPRVRRSSRSSVTDPSTETSNRLSRAGSRTALNDISTDSPRLRRSSSRTSVNDPSTDSNRLHRAGSRTAINDVSSDSSQSGRARTREPSGKASQTGAQSAAVASLVTADSKLTHKEEDALSERDYKERLKKLSRSRQNLYEGKR